MMTTTTTNPRIMSGSDPRIEENASAKLARKRAEAQRAADARNDRADTTTPLFPEKVGKADVETLPDPPQARPAPQIILSVTIPYRGRIITISGEGLNLDTFCDLLDKRLGVAS